MARKVKTNVVKRMWSIPVVRKKDSKVMFLEILAESYDAAILRVPDIYRIDEDSVGNCAKTSEN